MKRSIFTILKELIKVPGVAGFEGLVEQYISNFAKDNKLPYEEYPWYGIVIWSPTAPVYCMAHIDEVGGKIIHNWDTIQFIWIGRVYPNMFVWRNIEIVTDSGPVSWLVLWKKPLFLRYKKFEDLFIVVDEKEKYKIKKDDPIRYYPHREKSKNNLMATSLDNRISIAQLLMYITDRCKNKKDLFKNIAFVFPTEEELDTKWGIFFVKKYKPKYTYVFDMLPHSLAMNASLEKPIVLEKTLDYKLDPKVKEMFATYDVDYINSKSKWLKESEPMQYEKLSWGKSVNVMIPLYNYHHGDYAIRLSVFKKSNKLIKNIIDSLVWED